MMIRKVVALIFVAVLAFVGLAARADQAVEVTAPAASEPATQAAATDTPLMAGLTDIGVGPTLKDLGIKITGYVEGGYLYDATVPRPFEPGRKLNDFVAPGGAYKNAVILDQLELNLERDVDVPGKLQQGKWDFGFQIEGAYGRDTFYYHSNGILDQNVKHGGGPDNELDLTQAFVTIGVPVGNGLIIQAGKLASLLGYEQINPTLNALYSHSYQDFYVDPGTQTGVLASYNLTADQNLVATAGFTRGWNQSTSDNNGAADFLGEVVWKSADAKWKVTGNLSVGPQAPADNKDYWVVPEAIITNQVTKELSLSADVVYGYANAMGQWYGVCAYATYQINPQFAVTDRLEWYQDVDGFTTGVGRTDNFYEYTLGVEMTPLPDNQWLSGLTIRPEIRTDWSDHSVYDGTKFSQFTVALDAYLKF